MFVLPEDKAVITQLKDPDVANLSGFNGPWFSSNRRKASFFSEQQDAQDDQSKNFAVTAMQGLGCVIAFDLGKLIVRNAYSKRPLMTQLLDSSKNQIEKSTGKSDYQFSPAINIINL